MASSYSTLTCTQKSSSASVKCSRFLSCWVTGFIAAEHTLNTIWGTITWISGILWFPLVRMVNFFFSYYCPLYMHPSCLLFQAVLIVDELCILCLCKNRCKARESCRAGQIAQLKMVKTLRKGDEKNYVPKYCCLFLFFSDRKLCSPVCGKAHLSLEQRWCLPLYSVPVNQELSWSKKKKKGGGGAELVEMRPNICDVDTLLRNC